MKFFAAAALVAVASAAAIEPLQSRDAICSGLTPAPQCCAVSVAGLLDLDCGPPHGPYGTPEDFKATCVKEGKQPACCLLPILGLDVACDPISGI